MIRRAFRYAVSAASYCSAYAEQQCPSGARPGDTRRLAQALEGLTGLVVSLEGFRIPTLKESHRAELEPAYGRLAGIATLLGELDGFLVRRGRLVEPAQSPKGIGSFGQADRGHSDGVAVAGFRQELEPSAGLVEWTQRGLGLAALLQGPAETGMANRQVVGRAPRKPPPRLLSPRRGAAARAVRLPPPGRHRSVDRRWSIRPGSGRGSSRNPSEPRPRARAPLPRAGARGDGPGSEAGTPPSLAWSITDSTPIAPARRASPSATPSAARRLGRS